MLVALAPALAYRTAFGETVVKGQKISIAPAPSCI